MLNLAVIAASLVLCAVGYALVTVFERRMRKLTPAAPTPKHPPISGALCQTWLNEYERGFVIDHGDGTATVDTIPLWPGGYLLGDLIQLSPHGEAPYHIGPVINLRLFSHHILLWIPGSAELQPGSLLRLHLVLRRLGMSVRTEHVGSNMIFRVPYPEKRGGPLVIQDGHILVGLYQDADHPNADAEVVRYLLSQGIAHHLYSTPLTPTLFSA